MVLTATTLAEKLLELSPYKPVSLVSAAIRRFLVVDNGAPFEVQETEGKFSLPPAPEGMRRRVWILYNDSMVVLYEQWGDIVDYYEYRRPPAEMGYTEDGEVIRPERAVRRYNWHRSRPE